MSRNRYKPISFSKTLRNPLRILEFLLVISDFENQKLTNELCMDIEKELIRIHVYKPTKVSSEILNKRKKNEKLSDKEVAIVIKENPQNHKESHFDKGWPSRFSTHFSVIMELGLISIIMDLPIIITEKGKQLLNDDVDLVSILSHSIKHILIGSYMKPGTKNNQQVYLTFLKAFSLTKQINEQQFYALCCSKDSSMESIKFLLKNNTKSDIEKHWSSSFHMNEFENRNEVIDDIKRKLFLTSSFDFIKKNNKEMIVELKEEINIQDELNLIIHCSTLSDKKYWEKLSNRISVPTGKRHNKIDFINYWIEKLTFEDCSELLNCCMNKTKVNISELLYVPKFVLLEMAVGLIIFKTHKNIDINLNLNYDDHYIPTAPAPGGKPDIELKYFGRKINVEVTLLRGVSQHINESQSTIRHMTNSKSDSVLFLAPSISRDLASNYQFEIDRRNQDIGALKISSFLKLIESTNINEIIDLSKNVLIQKNIFDDNLFLKINKI
ncbi:AlwI family type II restriction endonuclease [Candidatus Mycoplasma mahonii]|uniref:AlwI family type II restriction endonuclease n=1 Tax=Candidatus Mycoplasma mahonii TaxID=3004105 RepID=UPI0026ED2F91|nr:AlwI family type II restriction endonuclease [Candidatus Mycoplasma mahonii]WKX02271.1 AlwI family type II restriction endonuclease [Candidatus Mycoplasma mahonii]